MWALRKFLGNSKGSHLTRQQHRPVVEHSCHLWVVRTERLFNNLRRPLIERLCLRVLSLQRDYAPQCQQRSQKRAVSRKLPNKNVPRTFLWLSPDTSTTTWLLRTTTATVYHNILPGNILRLLPDSTTSPARVLSKTTLIGQQNNVPGVSLRFVPDSPTPVVEHYNTHRAPQQLSWKFLTALTCLCNNPARLLSDSATSG